MKNKNDAQQSSDVKLDKLSVINRWKHLDLLTTNTQLLISLPCLIFAKYENVRE